MPTALDLHAGRGRLGIGEVPDLPLRPPRPCHPAGHFDMELIDYTTPADEPLTTCLTSVRAFFGADCAVSSGGGCGRASTGW